MEVPGRLERATLRSSEPCEPMCTPCQLDNSHKEAEGFCVICKEYLCASCVDYHQRLRATKSHSILKGTNIPNSPLTNNDQTACTEVCKKHPDKFIEYICHDHVVFMCVACATTGHRSCKIDYIPDAAQTFLESTEYKTLVSDMEKTRNKLGEIDQKIKLKQEKVEAIQQSFIEDLQNARTIINELFDKKEKILLEDALRLMKNNGEAIASAERRRAKLYQEWARLKQGLQPPGNHLSQFFVTAKHVIAEIKQIKCDDVFNEVHIQEYKFMLSESIKAMTDSDSSIGEIVKPCLTLSKSTGIKGDGKISVVDKADTCTLGSLILGIAVVCPNRLLLADSNNSSLKLVNTASQNATTLKLISQPRDVTALPDNKVAVTLPLIKMIKTFSVNDSLSEMRSFPVNGDCYGICFCAGKLKVAYREDGKLERIGLDGTVYTSVTIEPQASWLRGPYVAVKCQGTKSCIFLTNEQTSSITKFSMTGQKISQLQDKSLACGLVAVGEDYVAVCAKKEGKILLIAENDGTLDIVEEFDCVAEPLAIAFCPKVNKLYVSTACVRKRHHIYAYDITSSFRKKET